MNAEITGRLVVVKHRVKKTKDGEERPTMIGISENASSHSTTIELVDSLAELDYVHGKFPATWRPVVTGENLKDVEPHHIHFRDPEDDMTIGLALSIWPRESLRIEVSGRGKNKIETLTGIPTEVPDLFTGLKSGDTILAMFGGSGFSLMLAVLNKAHEIGARVLLCSPHNVKHYREGEHREKDEDHLTLIEMFRARPEQFHEIFPTDVKSWEVMANWDFTEEAMGQRLRIIQRATKRAEHEVCARNKYVGSQLAQAILDAKMGNRTVVEVMEEEKLCQKALEDSIESHPLFQYLFSGFKGIGPRFFGKILSSVRDIRRFPRKSVGAFLLFCGYGIVKGANGRPTIQRFLRGAQKNNPGNPEVKQAVWLLVSMQFVYQKDTPWGVRLRQIRDEMTVHQPNAVLECDTEIPLLKGKYSYNEETRECVVNFGRGRTQRFTGTLGKAIKVGKEIDVLCIAPETVKLPSGEDRWSVLNRLHTIKLPDETVIYRIGTNKWTKAHIWKNAQRRAGTEFLIWLYERWWTYIDEQEALRKKETSSESKAA